MRTVTLSIRGLKLQTQVNQYRNWRVRQAEVKRQRECVALHWRALPLADREGLSAPFLVTITRVGPRRVDSDNCVASAKAVRDQVAHELGIDDGDEDVARWVCAQRKGPFGVEVKIQVGRRDADAD